MLCNIIEHGLISNKKIDHFFHNKQSCHNYVVVGTAGNELTGRIIAHNPEV